ncbi:MAG TPA: hypothetical protein VJX10_02670 [Pseudonocardiaceae bacterium]|nr:hypothetical protein [Pseudonocardiaceae bacterium]
MNMWTDEYARIESDYRREQLHRLASQRRSAAERRTGAWRRWLPGGRRH